MARPSKLNFAKFRDIAPLRPQTFQTRRTIKPETFALPYKTLLVLILLGSKNSPTGPEERVMVGY